MQHWQMDLFDMQKFRNPQNRNKAFVLTVIDVFSKKIWLEAVASKSAKTKEPDPGQIQKALQDIFDNEGVTTQTELVLQSDQGPEFMAKKVQDFLKARGVKHVNSLSYSPTSQGIVERANGTVKAMLFKIMLQNGNNKYVEYLPAVASNINDTVHSVTGKTPNQVHGITGAEVVGEVHRRLQERANALLLARKYKVPKSFYIRRGDLVRVDYAAISSERRKLLKNKIEKETFKPKWSTDIYTVQYIKHWKDDLDMENYLIKLVGIDRLLQPNQVQKIYQPIQSRELATVYPNQQ
jgi:transposase InsO family protein